MFEGLVTLYPDDPGYRSRLVQAYDLANPESADVSALGRLETRLRRARDIIVPLAVARPDDLESASLRTRIIEKLGETLDRRGRPGEAEACYREAIAFAGSILARAPYAAAWIDRASTREVLARVVLRLGRRDQARAILDDAVADLRALKANDPDHPPIRARLASLTGAFEELGDPKRAGEVDRLVGEEDARPHRPPPARRGPLPR